MVHEFGYRKTAAKSLDTKYHLEPANYHKLDIDSGRTKDSGARLTYEPRNYVTTLSTNESAPGMARKCASVSTVGSISCKEENGLYKYIRAHWCKCEAPANSSRDSETITQGGRGRKSEGGVSSF
jgi:hypothetical protein